MTPLFSRNNDDIDALRNAEGPSTEQAAQAGARAMARLQGEITRSAASPASAVTETPTQNRPVERASTVHDLGEHRSRKRFGAALLAGAASIALVGGVVAWQNDAFTPDHDEPPLGTTIEPNPTPDVTSDDALPPLPPRDLPDPTALITLEEEQVLRFAMDLIGAQCAYEGRGSADRAVPLTLQELEATRAYTRHKWLDEMYAADVDIIHGALVNQTPFGPFESFSTALGEAENWGIDCDEQASIRVLDQTHEGDGAKYPDIPLPRVLPQTGEEPDYFQDIRNILEPHPTRRDFAECLGISRDATENAYVGNYYRDDSAEQMRANLEKNFRCYATSGLAQAAYDARAEWIAEHPEEVTRWENETQLLRDRLPVAQQIIDELRPGVEFQAARKPPRLPFPEYPDPTELLSVHEEQTLRFAMDIVGARCANDGDPSAARMMGTDEIRLLRANTRQRELLDFRENDLEALSDAKDIQGAYGDVSPGTTYLTRDSGWGEECDLRAAQKVLQHVKGMPANRMPLPRRKNTLADSADFFVDIRAELANHPARQAFGECVGLSGEKARTAIPGEAWASDDTAGSRSPEGDMDCYISSGLADAALQTQQQWRDEHPSNVVWWETDTQIMRNRVTAAWEIIAEHRPDVELPPVE